MHAAVRLLDDCLVAVMEMGEELKMIIEKSSSLSEDN